MKPVEPLPNEEEILFRQRRVDLAILTASAASRSAQAFEPLESLLHLLSLDQTLSDESRTYVTHARSSLACAYRGVADLLFLSRSRDSRGIVNLGAVVDATLSLLSNDIKTSNIHVQLSMEKDALLHTSRAEVRQLISSLILNTIRAPAEKDARIAIHVTRVSGDSHTEFVFSILTNGRWPVDERLFTLEEQHDFRVTPTENLPSTAGYLKLLLTTTRSRADLRIEAKDGLYNRHLRITLPENVPERRPSYPV